MRPLALLVALACLQPCAGGADELGRLFLTPAERAELEALRQVQAAARLAPVQPDAAAEPAAPERDQAPPAAVRFDGIVMRSDGNSTLWINGQNSYDGRVPELPVTLRPGAPARLEVQPDGAGTVVLKPGQRWEPLPANGNAGPGPAAGSR